MFQLSSGVLLGLVSMLAMFDTGQQGQLWMLLEQLNRCRELVDSHINKTQLYCKKTSLSFCVSVLRRAYFQLVNTSSQHSAVTLPEASLTPCYTRSETFLHTWPTLALGSVCAGIISSLLPHSGKEPLTFCLSSMAFFHSFDLDVTPGCFSSSCSLFLVNWNQQIEAENL